MDDASTPLRSIGDEATPAPRRVRWRLWMPLAAALLLPAAILGTGAWGAWHLTWTETERDLVRSAAVSADDVSRRIDSLARIARRIAVAGEDMPQDRVLDMVREQPLLRSVIVLDADGRRTLRVDVPPRGNTAPAAPGGDIREALDRVPADRIAIGEAYAAASGPLFTIGLRRRSGGPATILVLDATKTAAALGRLADTASDTMTLMRSDGQILARRPGFIDPPPPLPPARPLMRAIMEGKDSGSLMGVMPRDGYPVALAFSRVDDIPDLVVVAGRRRSDILDRWRLVMVPLILVGLPAVLALMGLALVVRRQQNVLEAAMDGLEQRVAERTNSLREGEERLRLAVEAGELGTWETDLHSGLSTRSPRTIDMAGLTPDHASSPLTDWSSRIHPADRRRVLDNWERLASGRASTYRAEYRFQRADGWRWFESTGTVVRTDPATGAPLRLAGTLQDITERREAEERRDLLTQEVNHRARNTLAIVQAILRLTRADTAAEFARLVEGRIAALARAQSLLAAEHWTGAPLATLITDELTPFGAVPAPGDPGDGRLRLDGPVFRIRAEAVQAMGMVFHELATNAAKHGALSVPGGRVTVGWRVDDDAAVLRIRWTETGGPAPGLPTRRGVGSRVIEATVHGQLGGSVERRWPDEGLTCDVVLPLAKARAGPG